jgi:RimJ/RimL family protein N-acetyltransferase
VLRRYESSDLAALTELVATSLENIRPWMPNATRELSGDLAEWLRSATEGFDRGDRYPYGIFLRDGTFVGHVGVTPRDGLLFFGYWAHARHLRYGYVSEAVGALVEAFRPATFVIHCSPDNPASMGVARKAGFVHVGFDETTVEGRAYSEMRWELVVSAR